MVDVTSHFFSIALKNYHQKKGRGLLITERTVKANIQNKFATLPQSNWDKRRFLTMAISAEPLLLALILYLGNTNTHIHTHKKNTPS